SGERLSKDMVPRSHQTWERGDLLALEFANPSDEAQWIVRRIEELQGMPFTDRPDAQPRGLSWSDCAVLYRTVKDAEPLVEELRRRGSPYIIKGLARLFDAPEIQAVVGMFRFMVGDISALDLARLLKSANLQHDPALLARGIRILEDGADFDRGDRWGVYNIQRLYLDALEALNIRESTVPGTPARAELVMYQLGKFSQVISDFEAIHFASAPENKYRSFVGFLENQAP